MANPDVNNPNPADIQPDAGDGTPSNLNAGDGTGMGTGEGKTTPTGEGDNENQFLSPEEIKAVDDHLENAPELKPYKEAVYKQMQAGFTKAMQAVPKEYRSKEAMDALIEKAKVLDDIDADDELSTYVDNYLSGKKPQTEAKTPTDPTAKANEEFKGESEGEKEFWSRPTTRARVKNILESEYGRDFATVRETRDDKGFAQLKEMYPGAKDKIDLYRKEILAYGKKHIGVTYEDAFLSIAGKSLFKQQASDQKAAQATMAQAETDAFVAGQGGGGSGKPAQDFGKMSLDEMEKNLPHVDR